MLKDPLRAGFDQVELVGFAIRRTQEQRQFHVGLLYKTGKSVHIRHQCAHLVVKDDRPDPIFLWTDISALSSLNKRLIANKLSRAGGDKVPYGVGYRLNGNYLDKKTLKYAVPDPGEGLTCATYIVAVMETLGFTPFDRKGWLSTEEDVAWQEQIIEKQAAIHRESAAHFEAEKKHIGEPRFRPDHVVAAGNASWPLTQALANELGKRVIASYDSQRP